MLFFVKVQSSKCVYVWERSLVCESLHFAAYFLLVNCHSSN